LVILVILVVNIVAGDPAMQRSTDRILTTHVGSLVRPKALVAAAAAARADPAALPPYEATLRDAVADVVRRQVEAGIDIVNDGEYSKSSWANYMLERLEGFEVREGQRRKVEWLGRDLERFPEVMAAEMPMFVPDAAVQACVGPVRYRETDTIRRALAIFKAALGETGAEGFFTAVAPASTAYNGVDEHYGSEEAYVYAVADALRTEYREIHAAGLVLQVDDAVLANMYETLVERSPEHYRRWAGLRVEALNHALAGIPEDRVRYHVCFGSWHVPHMSDAPLSAIVDLVLQVRAGAYAIEAANPRHEHEWRVWEDVRLPEGRILIPGVVTHHTIIVEHPELVADRIVRFARLVGRESLIAGTDCGFAQTEQIERVHPSVMWAKLEALAEGARIASRVLWD
jgi:5-methyltetrahydropteroyltriglutamate--homocysteine methyltransferase